MRTPRTLFIAIASVFATAFVPASANEAETVKIQIDLDAPAAEIYRSIRQQAWTACKPEMGSHYVAARTTARRQCQEDLIAQVVTQLPSSDIIRLAKRDGIRTES